MRTHLDPEVLRIEKRCPAITRSEGKHDQKIRPHNRRSRVRGSGPGGPPLRGRTALGTPARGGTRLPRAGPDTRRSQVRLRRRHHDLGRRSHLELPRQGNGRSRDRRPRGRVTGGSSAVNDAQFLWPMPEDLDLWAQWGNTQWGFENVLPHLIKLENDQDFRDEFHGNAGPISCRRYPDSEWRPQQRAFYQACLDAGFPDCPDHNRPGSTGVGPLTFNIDGRTRVSTAIGYLGSARRRENLTIVPDTLVHQVSFDGTRAVGVRGTTPGQSRLQHLQYELAHCILNIDNIGPRLRFECDRKPANRLKFASLML